MQIEFRAVPSLVLFLVTTGAACSRASSPVPASESAVRPSPSAAAMDARPEPIAPASTPVSVPAEPASPPSASAAVASPSSTPSNPKTKAEDCSRYDSAPEHRNLSAEDRARSRTTCEAKEEFRAFVAARQTCSSAGECTSVAGACPFGCFVPVARSAASEVTSKLDALGARLDKAGNRCVYRCMGAPSAACVDGRCAAGPR